jgi:hypothetical protein
MRGIPSIRDRTDLAGPYFGPVATGRQSGRGRASGLLWTAALTTDILESSREGVATA